MNQQAESATEQRGEPLAAPGVRPSRREREKARAGEAFKPEKATENETDASAQQLVESGAVKEREQQQEQQGDQEQGAAQENGEPGELTFKALAEKLEMKPADLYALQIPDGLGAGGHVSLGELKDFYRSNRDNVERLANVDREEVMLRTERGRAVRDLDQLVSLLPRDAISPQYIQAVQEQARVISQHELQRLVQVAPEFRDPVGFQQARMGMAEAAQAYGLTPADVDNIIDHRWLLALHDLAKLRGAKSQAAKLIADSSGGSTPGTNQQARAKPKAAGKKGDTDAQTNGVLGLLINHAKRQ